MKLSEAEFERIVDGIDRERESIYKHNPVGTESETLLWMLLSCLCSYLSLDDSQAPCFTGRPDAQTYRAAISFVLKDRRAGDFNIAPYLDRLSN
jgi:hypothetical protein